MALQQVRALAFDSLQSNQLPNPHDGSTGSTYLSGTIMDDANFADVYAARAVNAALAERDKKIEELRKSLGDLAARFCFSAMATFGWPRLSV
jgi:hypothetical protein